MLSHPTVPLNVISMTVIFQVHTEIQTHGQLTGCCAPGTVDLHLAVETPSEIYVLLEHGDLGDLRSMMKNRRSCRGSSRQQGLTELELRSTVALPLTRALAQMHEQVMRQRRLSRSVQ